MSKLSCINLAFAAGLCCAVLLAQVAGLTTERDPAVWLTGIASVLAALAALREANGVARYRHVLADLEARVRVLESHRR